MTAADVGIGVYDIKLVNGSATNEGRVLIRWLPDSPWTAVCYNDFDERISYSMCRGLGYPFGCWQGVAGMNRTDAESLENLPNVLVSASCRDVQGGDKFAGRCMLLPELSSIDRLHQCVHEHDTWLSCGYAGMFYTLKHSRVKIDPDSVCSSVPETHLGQADLGDRIQ